MCLESKGIKAVLDLSEYSIKEIKAFHRIGPSSIPEVIVELNNIDLIFKEDYSIKCGLNLLIFLFSF